MMGQAVEERGRHLGIAEHGRPFAKVKVGRHDDGCSLVKSADEVEQELSTGLREREVSVD